MALLPIIRCNFWHGQNLQIYKSHIRKRKPLLIQFKHQRRFLLWLTHYLNTSAATLHRLATISCLTWHYRRKKNRVTSAWARDDFLQKNRHKRYIACDDAGGELGIRTLGTFLYTAFRVLHLRPLGQLSVYVFCFPFRTGRQNNFIIFGIYSV